MTDEVLYHDLPDVAEFPLSTDELRVLRDMMDTEGWRILMKIKEAEANMAAATALSPMLNVGRSEAERIREINRAIHLAASRDLTMKDRIDEAIQKSGLPKATIVFPDPAPAINPKVRKKVVIDAKKWFSQFCLKK